MRHPGVDLGARGDEPFREEAEGDAWQWGGIASGSDSRPVDELWKAWGDALEKVTQALASPLGGRIRWARRGSLRSKRAAA
jgi:hypothetical protein